MTGERTKAILKAGIVSPDTVQELSRWGSDLPEVVPERDAEAALDNIREAVEGPETVEIRQTDLDVLRAYEAGRTRGRLYFANGTSTTFVEVDYAQDRLGNYIIPWRDSDDISGLMLEPTTYLKPTGQDGVHFMDVRELHMGENKVFILATPSSPLEDL